MRHHGIGRWMLWLVLAMPALVLLLTACPGGGGSGY